MSSALARAALFSLCCLHTPALPAAPARSGVVAGSGTTSGGVFTAGAAGAEYALPSQARLRLAPRSAVRIFPVAQALSLTPGKKTQTWSFSLLHGRADVVVPGQPRSAVLASVGKLSVIVTRGEASIVASGEATTVLNSEGEVRTLLSERWQTLTPGTLLRFGGPHPSSAPEPAIAAPALAAGQRLWFSPGGAVPVGGLRLAAVPGAAGYELRLRSKDGAQQQLRSLSDTQQREPFAPLEPGQYELTARSVDRDGLAGRWSRPQALRVLGVMLPPGGYVEGGGIYIGPGQEVRFSHTDGLEMTYQGAGRYVPASQALTLYREELTVVSFRIPGSLDATTARLIPRSVYADVTIGPRRAVWPTDAVEIVVEVRSKAGRAVPEWLELKPEVRLGVEPIEVSFRRDGNRLVGSVPRPSKPGPWVLRVEVKDQFGAALGRDFLEIAAATPAAPAPARAQKVAAK